MSLTSRISRLAQYDPADAAQREFDTVLGRLFGSPEIGAMNTWAPYGVDVREDADHVFVEAELPGFRKEDVEITVENSILTFTAQRSERASEGEADKPQWPLRERRFNRVERSFTLPHTVNEQSVKAVLTDGILTITLDKREETKPRKVPVS
jgi:HSP20 family protein